MKRQLLAASLLSLLALPAAASSDGAWKEFAADVKAKCLAATKGSIEAPKIAVDPYGSQNYGLAIVTGKAKGASTKISHICVYDKKAKTVEIGGELGSDMVKIELPASTKAGR